MIPTLHFDHLNIHLNSLLERGNDGMDHLFPATLIMEPVRLGMAQHWEMIHFVIIPKMIRAVILGLAWLNKWVSLHGNITCNILKLWRTCLPRNWSSNTWILNSPLWFRLMQAMSPWGPSFCKQRKGRSATLRIYIKYTIGLYGDALLKTKLKYDPGSYLRENLKSYMNIVMYLEKWEKYI